MNLQAFLPPLWSLSVACALLALSVLLRLRWSLGWGGRLNVFVLPLAGWLAMIYFLAQFKLAGFGDPALLALAARPVFLLMLVVMALINIATAFDNRRILSIYKRLGIEAY